MCSADLAARNRDDAHARMVARENANHLEAIGVRHDDVGDDEVGLSLVHRTQRVAAVVDGLDGVTGVLERVPEYAADAGIVFDYENC